MKEKGVSPAVIIVIVIVIAAVGVGGYLLLKGEGKEGGGGEGGSPVPYYEIIATVTSMVDGDTTWVQIENIVVELDPTGEVYEGNQELVRYGGGVDAPELWTYTPPRTGEPGSVEATELIENLIPVGTTVYLDLNALSTGGQTGRPYRGVYERLIAVIYTVIDNQWINVNAELLRWGQKEYPDFDWLKYRYFPSEWNPDEWLEENYPYVLS